MRTYTDAISAVIRAIRGHGYVASLDVVKSGVCSGMNNFFLAAHWTRYKTTTAVHCHAPQTSGTVSYDASTMTASLTGASFPAWADGCAIVIRGEYGRIAEVLSPSTARLMFGPDSDKTGASYVLYHDRVKLPADAVSVMAVNSRLQSHLSTVSPERLQAWEVESVVSGVPYAVAVESASDGRYLRFWPYPGQKMTYYIMYRRSPGMLLYTGREEQDYAGLVNVAGDAVSGTGTAFHSGMVGLVFRVSRNTELPTGIDGSNPYAGESLVSAVTSSTAMQLRDAIGNWSGRKYCVASLLDVDDWAYNALIGFALDETARLIGAKIAVDLAADMDAALAADVSQSQGTIYGTASQVRTRYIYPMVSGN